MLVVLILVRCLDVYTVYILYTAMDGWIEDIEDVSKSRCVNTQHLLAILCIVAGLLLFIYCHELSFFLSGEMRRDETRTNNTDSAQPSNFKTT